MKKTYLLIKVKTSMVDPNTIEDVYGVSTNIETLKEVALEENDYKPLEWTQTMLCRSPHAKITGGLRFEIITINDYEN